MSQEASSSRESSERKSSSRSSKSRSMQRRAVLRNNFLMAGYRRIILATFFSLLGNALGLGLLFWTLSWKSEDAYIPIFADSRLLIEPPLNEIYGSENDVMKFADSAIRSIFTYDYKNYVGQFQTTHSYFTENGWQRFAEGVKFSGALDMVKKGKMVVSVNILGAPVIKKSEMYGGRLGWVVSVPNVKVTYESPNSKSAESITQPRTIEMLIVRTPLKERPLGYAIATITERQE